jgi:hypothetical protein
MHGLLAWQQPRITLITAIQITQVQTASRTMIVVAMIKHTTRTTMDSIEATTIMYKAMVMIKMITIEHNEPKLGCITTVVTVAPPTVAAVWYNGYSHTLHLSISLSLSLSLSRSPNSSQMCRQYCVLCLQAGEERNQAQVIMEQLLQSLPRTTLCLLELDRFLGELLIHSNS